VIRLFRRGPVYWVTGVYRDERFRVSTHEIGIVVATRYKEVLVALLREADHLRIVVDPCGKLEKIAESVARAWQRSPYNMKME
jgi:hypothetical protein